MTRLRSVLLVVLVGLLGYGIGILQPYVLRPELVVGQDAAVADAGPVTTRLAEAGGRVLVVEPAQTEPTLALVFYTGALVRPQAYEWIGHALASRGVRTLIPEFGADMAFTNANRAEIVAETLAPGLPVVIGGHSLGGAMAAQYAADHKDVVTGLVMLGAYPPDRADLGDAPFAALTLLAEHDQVLDADAQASSLDRLPPVHEEVVITGAVHSFFGRYGPQAGDGVPTVTRAEAERQITATLLRFTDGMA